MIVSIEGEMNNLKTKKTLFGEEYIFEMVGPNIDATKYNRISLVDVYIVTDRETVNNLITLSTTMIDKSSGNPNQEIYKFCKTKKSSTLYEKPTLRDEYKILCSSLCQSVFTFSFLKKVEKIKIRARFKFTVCRTDSLNQ